MTLPNAAKIILLLQAAAVINGGSETHPALPGQFPYVVGFKSPNFELENFCSGAIIGRQHVLTSAWCTPDPKLKYMRYTILAGCVDKTSSDCIEYEVQDVDPHPEYSGTKHSISILTLKKPFTFSELIQKIPISTRKLKTSDRVLKTGWNGDQLEWSEVQVSSEEACKKKWQGEEVAVYEDFDNFFCTEDGREDAWADLGGTVVLDDGLVGLTHFSEEWHQRMNVYSEFVRYVFVTQDAFKIRSLMNMKKLYEYDEDLGRIVRKEEVV